jgi:hypothetical protein
VEAGKELDEERSPSLALRCFSVIVALAYFDDCKFCHHNSSTVQIFWPQESPTEQCTVNVPLRRCRIRVSKYEI